MGRDEMSALLDNAGVLSQQASKYSKDCGVILLCNYQNMIALDFTNGTGNARWNDLEFPVKYFWSDESTLTHK
jgi:hypothetical protein